MVSLSSLKSDFNTTLEAFKKALSKLRTGQASIDMVDELTADYYGVPTPIKQIASISIPEPRMILITPWDKSAVAVIEKAILQATHLGINPVADNSGVRLQIPALTEERRKLLVKEAYAIAEQFKGELRKIREEVRNEIKEMVKQKEISEDEQYVQFEHIDTETKVATTQLEDIVKQKETTILTV